LPLSYRGCDDDVVAVSTGELASLPACGCDACDDGYTRMLEELDAAMVRVVHN